MAVGFVASASSGSQASVASFSIGTLGTGARAGIVFVCTHNSATAKDTGVTWNGVAMTLLYSATDTDTEPGVVRAYFLDNVTNGTITVSRTNDATVTVGYAASISASYAAYVSQTITRVASTQNTNANTSTTGTGASGEVAVDDGSPGSSSMRFAAYYSGAATPPAQGTNSTALQVLDSTALGSRFVRETTAGQGSRSVGAATGTTDDWALVAVAVSEKSPKTITLDLLDASNALYAPTVTGIAPQDIDLGLLDGAAALYSPTLTPKNTISLPLLEAIVGASTPTVRNTSSYVSSASETSIVVPVPSGVQDGDVMFCHIHVTASSGNITRNTAWTAIYENQFSGSSTSSRSSLFYRVASSEPADYTWTIPSGRSSASVVAMYGVDATTPVEASQVAVDTVAGTTVTAPTVTSTNGTKLLTWHGGRTATTGVSTSYTPDAGMDSELVDVSSAVAASSNSSHEVAIDTVTAGASTGTRAATASQSVNWIAFSVIPKPATGAGESLFAPTLTLAPYPITLPLLDGGAALYAPDLAQSGSSPQDITLDLLDSGADLYAPTLLPQPVTITLDLLDATNALYAPTLAPKNTITLALLDAGRTLYAPSISGVNAVTLPLLDAGNALYAPTLVSKNTVVVPLLDGANALYAPSLTLAPYPITLPLLDGVAELYAPALVGGSVIITLPLLDAGPALYAPTLQSDQLISLDLLDAAAALYAPTLTVGAVSATLPLLDAGNALYQPTLVGKNTIVIPLLDGERALYDPQVWGAAQTIVVGLLDASGALYAPTLTQSNTLVIPLLNAGSELYPPSLSTVGALIYGHTRDVNGRPIPYATVDVFVTATNAFYKTTTSDAVGLYQVLVESGVEYFIVAYTAVEFGTSARSLVGV